MSICLPWIWSLNRFYINLPLQPYYFQPNQDQYSRRNHHPVNDQMKTRWCVHKFMQLLSQCVLDWQISKFSLWFWFHVQSSKSSYDRSYDEFQFQTHFNCLKLQISFYNSFRSQSLHHPLVRFSVVFLVFHHLHQSCVYFFDEPFTT
jgi:hypothetical protein